MSAASVSVPVVRPLSRRKPLRGPLHPPPRRRVPGLPMLVARRSSRPSGCALAGVVPRSDLHALLLTLGRRGRGRRVAAEALVARALDEHPARFRRGGRPDASVVRAALAKLLARGLLALAADGYRLTPEGWRVAASGDLRAAARARRVTRVRAAIDARVRATRCPRSRAA
jgi:hypothetical protein